MRTSRIMATAVDEACEDCDTYGGDLVCERLLGDNYYVLCGPCAVIRGACEDCEGTGEVVCIYTGAPTTCGCQA